jgi:hypothetical protein
MVHLTEKLTELEYQKMPVRRIVTLSITDRKRYQKEKGEAGRPVPQLIM